MALSPWKAGWRNWQEIFFSCFQYFLSNVVNTFYYIPHHQLSCGTPLYSIKHFSSIVCLHYSTSSVPYYFRPILRAFIMRHNKCFSNSMLLWLLSIYSSFISYFREYFWYLTLAQLLSLWWMPNSVSISRFWHCHEKRLIKTIQRIPHNL